MNSRAGAQTYHEIGETGSELRKAYLQDRLQLPPPPPLGPHESIELQSITRSGDSDDMLQSFYMTIDSDSLDQPYRASSVRYQNANNQQPKQKSRSHCYQKICLCLTLLIIVLLSSCAACMGLLLLFYQADLHNVKLENFFQPLQDISKTFSEVLNLTQAVESRYALNKIDKKLDQVISNDHATQELLVKFLNDSNHGFHSCAAIKLLSSTSPSGYYSVQGLNGSLSLVYCDMGRSCGGVVGGWTRAVKLDVQQCDIKCPDGLVQRNLSNFNNTRCICGIKTYPPGCSSVFFSLPGYMEYSKVCGKVKGYSVGRLHAYEVTNISGGINGVYVDGVSLTHGWPMSRTHIWTFAVGTRNISDCSCNNVNMSHPPPSFVGSDYFCNVADPGLFPESGYSGPLWDGQIESGCSNNLPPWFYRDLPAPTSEALEMRLCSDGYRSNEDVAVEAIELYVQ